MPGAKARDQSRTFPGALKRSFHQEVYSKGLHSVVPQPVKPVSRAMARCIAEAGLFICFGSFEGARLQPCRYERRELGFSPGGKSPAAAGLNTEVPQWLKPP